MHLLALFIDDYLHLFKHLTLKSSNLYLLKFTQPYIKSIDMLDDIVRNGAISDTSLRMLIKKIIITEKKGKLKTKIQLNADFSTHIDFLHDEDDPIFRFQGDILVIPK